MVFNVTVPDPVLLRCYPRSETTTNQKQGGLRLSAFPSPLLVLSSQTSVHRAVICSEQGFRLVRFGSVRFGSVVLPSVATHRTASHQGLAPELGRSGPGLAWRVLRFHT